MCNPHATVLEVDRPACSRQEHPGYQDKREQLETPAQDLAGGSHHTDGAQHRQRAALADLLRAEGPAGWSEPAFAPFSLPRYPELEPFITADGQWLYFISKPGQAISYPIGTPATKADLLTDPWENLYVYTRNEDGTFLIVTYAADGKEGPGETVEEIRLELAETPPLRKLSFSCFGEEAFTRRLKAHDRRTLILTGMEAHICVAQTALKASLDYRIVVIADAAASRSPNDRDMAFARLRENGVTIVSTEMLMYEWLERAGTDTFRAALPLLK